MEGRLKRMFTWLLVHAKCTARVGVMIGAFIQNFLAKKGRGFESGYGAARWLLSVEGHSFSSENYGREGGKSHSQSAILLCYFLRSSKTSAARFYLPRRPIPAALLLLVLLQPFPPWRPPIPRKRSKALGKACGLRVKKYPGAASVTKNAKRIHFKIYWVLRMKTTLKKTGKVDSVKLTEKRENGANSTWRLKTRMTKGNRRTMDLFCKRMKVRTRIRRAMTRKRTRKEGSARAKIVEF